MTNYSFFSYCVMAIMQDKSGVAIYNGLSGNTAFIGTLCSIEDNHDFIERKQMNFDDFALWLGISKKDVETQLNWLLINEFIYSC